MLFPGRRTGPPLPLLWRVFLINAAMLTVVTLALAFSPATVSFPIAVTEGLVLGGGLAATLALDLLVLRRALGSALAATGVAQEAGASGRRALVMPSVDLLPTPPQAAHGQQGAEAAKDEVGTRLLVGWSRPYHLSDTDAEAWAATELTRVLAVAGTDRARLTRLRSASLLYDRPWDWLLELDVAAYRDVRHCVESPAWRELLGDLRLLGLRPAAMVADSNRVLSGGRD